MYKRSEQSPYLKSLANCLEKIRTGGYTENFNKVTEGLLATHANHTYPPGTYKVVSTFQFEAISHPGEEAIMYMIETNDGLKGTLVRENSSTH